MLPQTSSINVQDYLEILYRRIWYVVIPFVISVGVAIALCYYLPKSYLSSASILVERQKVEVGSHISPGIESRLGSIREQIMSRAFLQKVIDEFKLYGMDAQKEAPDEIIKFMRKNIEIKVGSETGDAREKIIDSFVIAYQGGDPYSVMQVTNKLASLFIEENLKAREGFVIGTTIFLDTELEGIKAEIERQEARLQEFKRRHIGELPEQMGANLSTLARLQLDIQSTTEAISRAEERKVLLSGGTLDNNNIIIIDPDQARLYQLEDELAELRSRFTDKHPEIIQKNHEIEKVRRRMTTMQAGAGKNPAGQTSKQLQSPPASKLQYQIQELNFEIERLKSKQKTLDEQIRVYQARVENTPLQEQQMLILQRDYENTKKNYQSLLDKKLNARISENLEKRQQGEQIRILDPANLPTKPYSPDQNRILLMGLLIGLATGVGSAYLREMADTSFARPEELEAALQLPVLAAIPNIAIALKKERKAG
ncbi:MAG: GNVR domain-containing protein [Nitrospirota bacterium]